MELSSSRFSLWIFGLFGFITMMSIGISFPIFSFLALKSHTFLILKQASPSERTLVLSALLVTSPLFSVIFAPIVGNFADQKGRKPILLIALFILIMGPLLSAIAILFKNLFLLFISRVISGIGASGNAVLGAAIADISPPKKKPKNFAFLSAMSSLGFMVGPFIGGKLSQNETYENPFFVVSFLSLINLLLMIFFFKDPFHVKKEENKESLFSHLKHVFKYEKIRLFLFSTPLFNIGFYIYWQFISINLIEQYKLNETQVGNLYTYGAAWFAICSGLLIRPILSRFHNLTIAFFSSCFLGFLILLLLFRTGVGLFWIIIPFQEFFLALLGPTAMTFISNAVKEEDQGKVMGVVQSLWSGSFVVAPLLGGVFSELGYDSHILFGGIIILLFSCVILFRYHMQIFTKNI